MWSGGPMSWDGSAGPRRVYNYDLGYACTTPWSRICKLHGFFKGAEG